MVFHVHLGAQLFPKSNLLVSLSGEFVCRVHTLSAEVVSRDVVHCDVEDGSHPAIASAVGGFKGCIVPEIVLRKDRALLRAALTLEIPGFSYLKPGGLDRTRKWKTGVVMGLESYGRGYCYLTLFPPEAQMRIARLLGPYPLVGDVWLLFRLLGLFVVPGVLLEVAPGIMHVTTSGRTTGRAVAANLIDAFLANPDVVIGAVGDVGCCVICGEPTKICRDGFLFCLGCQRKRWPLDTGSRCEGYGDPIIQATVKQCDSGLPRLCKRNVSESWGVSAKPLKVHCEDCGFMVVAEGHKDRCRVPVARDKEREFLGDAVHMLDVKYSIIAHGFPVGHPYVQKFTSAMGQKSYLKLLGYDYEDELSAHSLGSRFESLYTGEFRRAYLLWLHGELGGHGYIADSKYRAFVPVGIGCHAHGGGFYLLYLCVAFCVGFAVAKCGFY